MNGQAPFLLHTKSAKLPTGTKLPQLGCSMSVEKEITVRPALLSQLRDLVPLDADCVLVEELGVEHGAARIDVAAIGASLHGFEIKAASDSLRRLDRQIMYYEKLVDFAYLVLTEKHATSITQTLPTHWGVILAYCNGSRIQFSLVRHAARNPNRDAESMARLLWRNEALATLVALGLDRGLRRKSARILHQQLASAIELKALSTLVLDRIRQRASWGARQKKPISLATTTFAEGNVPAT